MGMCLKENCANRDKMCNGCMNFSEYKKHPLTYCSEHGHVRCDCAEKFKEMKNA